MILFLMISLLWFLILFFARPKPSNLREKVPDRRKSFKEIKATFILGLLLIAIYFTFSNGTIADTNNDIVKLFGVNNIEVFTPWWFIQTFTQNFIHMNFYHLVSNLSLLGLLSLYERKVGLKKFLIIFLFSGTLSSISVLFVQQPTITIGSSAGLFGLAAAYMLDNKKLNFKENIITIIFIFMVYWVLNFQTKTQLLNIDNNGHILGLILGMIFVKIFPNKINYNY